MRQVILDTETTGLRVEEGHRIIEIGCLEMINRKLTGKHFHYFINPEREIEAGAQAVHGITNEFLKDKPLFANIIDALIEFISDSELIIHNAPFDVGFLNHEFQLIRKNYRTVTDYCQVIDTLQIARQIHVGQRNSLDALCKRYGVDNSKRDLHGALLDANLLAQVYLAMTGGQGNFFDSLSTAQSPEIKNAETKIQSTNATFNIHVIYADNEEVGEHQKYLQQLKKQGKCIWDDEPITT